MDARSEVAVIDAADVVVASKFQDLEDGRFAGTDQPQVLTRRFGGPTDMETSPCTAPS